MDNKRIYKEDSIESLSPLEFTRLKPGVYAGDTTYATQLLVEIVSNSIDEYRNGFGDTIDVTIDGDIITVKDKGQGFIPNHFRDDKKTILEAAFSVLNTSGKYREDGAYEGTSLGSFGIGSKLTNFLSHWLEVTTVRDSQMEKIKFVEGVFESREVKAASAGFSGTVVSWQPSEQFFTNTEIELPKVKELFETITCLCPGLTINLIDKKNNTTKKFYSERGLEDLVDNAVGGDEIIQNRFSFHHEVNKEKIDFILTYTNKYSSTIVPYVNTGLTEKGPHITQIKTLITREFNKFFREKKWLKEKDENLTGDDIQEGMYIVFNVTAAGVAYNAQVKSTVTKIEMKNVVQALSDGLAEWLRNNEKEIKVIADKATTARKAREAARQAKDIARNGKKKEKGLKAKMALSNKFIDCISKDPKERNLLLVEGLSAGSSAVEARCTKTDCIYMLRGKIISPLKTALDKILKNQEMSDLITIIGGGFGNDFDISKINFDKIVITTDMDSDGSDIALLLTTFFYTYMRPLVEAGKLYRAITPLYILRKKDKEIYLYTENEFDEWRTKGETGWTVIRAKGLGELDPTDLKKVCFERQRFKRITVSDIERTTALLNTLQGQAVEPRKRYIYENARELGFNFD